jgi:hypothetical protein
MKIHPAVLKLPVIGQRKLRHSTELQMCLKGVLDTKYTVTSTHQSHLSSYCIGIDMYICWALVINILILVESVLQGMRDWALQLACNCCRYLVKNLVLGYFMASPNTRNQVLRIVATVLDFNQEERDRVGLESGTSPTGWFRSFLQPGKGPSNMQVHYQIIILYAAYI